MFTETSAAFDVRQLKSIFASVPSLSFSADQWSDLVDFLDAQSEDTVIEPISDVNQLRLRADGTIADTGYRFNPIGFSAVASALATGLNSVFNKLAGEIDYKHAAGEETANVPAAVSVFNIVLQANFSHVQERSVIINHATKTVEGFLGLDHKMLANKSFVALVSREIEAVRGSEAEFYRAELLGREIRLYYSDAKNKWDYFYGDSPHRVGGGWYFANREDSGTAIRASTALFTRFGLGVYDNKGRNHVRHSGADLFGRTSVLISRVIHSDFYPQEKLEPALRKLSSRKLFTHAEDTFDSAVSRWVSFLTDRKISRDDAKNIVRNAFVVGADISTSAQLTRYDHPELAARTVYDLFCSMLRYARTQYHTTKDLVQKVALDVVLSQVKN
jgi:hypothetical protein